MQTKPFAFSKPLTIAATSRWRVFLLIGITVLAFTSCQIPVEIPGDPGRFMRWAAAATGTPPPDKSIVRIHRPRALQGHHCPVDVWDSERLIAFLPDGGSTAYVCDPGTHFFVNRSAERVGVVEARLLPSRTYDLWIDTAVAFVPSFQLKPVNRGSRQWDKVPIWMKDNFWLERVPDAAGFEAKCKVEIEIILEDFVYGEKKDRLRHLALDDYREAQ